MRFLSQRITLIWSLTNISVANRPIPKRVIRIINMEIMIIIIINSFYRAQITFKSLSAFRTRIDRHMYKNTQKHEEEKYQTEKHIIKYHSLHNNGNYFTNK